MRMYLPLRLWLTCAALACIPLQSFAQALEYRSVWFPGGHDAEEILRTADWYKAVFGMLEVQRFGTGRGVSLGIGLQFGRTLEEAKATKGLIMGIAKSYAGEPGSAGKDKTARVSFNVTNLDVLLKRATDFGGKIVSQPARREIGTVAIVADAYGNLIELVAAANSTSAERPAISWRTVRFPAVDAERNAVFYKRVLGMQEISRSGPKQKPEIVLNFGNTVAEAKAGRQVPITIASVDERPGPLLTTFASQLAMGFTEYATVRDVLTRAYNEGTAFLSDPHYIAPTATFARFIDPDGTYLELAGRCTPAEVPDVSREVADYICGPANAPRVAH